MNGGFNMSIWSKIKMVEKQIENYNRLKNTDASNEWFYNDHYIDIFGLKNKYVSLVRESRKLR